MRCLLSRSQMNSHKGRNVGPLLDFGSHWDRGKCRSLWDLGVSLRLESILRLQILIVSNIHRGGYTGLLWDFSGDSEFLWRGERLKWHICIGKCYISFNKVNMKEFFFGQTWRHIFEKIPKFWVYSFYFGWCLMAIFNSNISKLG